MDKAFQEAQAILKEVETFEADSAESLESFRIEYLGSKGKLKDLFSQFKAIPADQKKAYGQIVNNIKTSAEAKLKAYTDQFKSEIAIDPTLDLTAPAYRDKIGSRHPINITRKQIIDIFNRIGYTVEDGPEIEDDWHNFTALNLPKDHPARDMQDTFYITEDQEILLRTHTSTGQIRVMEREKPPIRILTPGRVYRNETISARAHCTFHQVEGLYIDEGVSFADLKQTLLYFAREMFGKDSEIRLRPSYFPFTEPSAEMDVSCFICKQEGCPVCKGTGWVEIMGCGMVDPAVLENCNIDSEKYTGFAFGMGIERVAMLRYQINDIRLFFENDVRFLNQFKSLD